MKGVTKGWTKTLSVTRWLLALALIGGCHAVTPPATDKPRVVVIANTVAEADGLMAVLNSSEVRPEHLGAPKPASEYPRAPSTKPPEGLRGFYEGNGIRVEFWCVWELPGAKASIDGTPYKVKELPNVTQPGGKAPAMVIAFGTAAGHWETSHNGVVVVGSAVLFHSLPSLEDKDVTEALQRRGAVADQIIESPRGAAFLSKVLAGSFGEKRSEIEAKFLKPPLNPAFDP